MPDNILSVQTYLEFMSIFKGNSNGYGVHKYTGEYEGTKEKGISITVNEILTDIQYKQHLQGVQGLGVSPITENNECHFAVIDIDNYDREKIGRYVAKIYEFNFPLIPFYSKSGGLHLYMFFSTPVKAKDAVNAMKKLMYILDIPKDTEIFPKQTALESNSIGNWINLPYYNHSSTKSGLIDSSMNILPIDEALEHITTKLVSDLTKEEYLLKLPLSDAPPCLQVIYISRDTAHRNDYLFSLARYYKTKVGVEEFEYRIVEANSLLIRPITIEELQKSIISTHKKKDYTYACKKAPICELCNKALCKTREFGIGGEEVSDLSFGEFTQFTTDPPYYEWIVNDQVLKFYDENDIIQQTQFRRLCMRQLHRLPIQLKKGNWESIVDNAIRQVVVKRVEDEFDISPGAMLKEFLKEFFEDKALATSRADIRADRVYRDIEKKLYIFRAKNLVNYLHNVKQFRYYGLVQLQNKLKQLGGFPSRYYIPEFQVTERVWCLPIDCIERFKDEKVIDTYEVDMTVEDTFNEYDY